MPQTMTATLEAPPARPTLSVLDGPAPSSSAAPTVSAAEMVRLTGIGRERLRTWERRHGFPAAVRLRNNVRRYEVDQVRQVAAVHQLTTSGLPLAEAIESVLSGESTETTLESLGTALDHAPMPGIAICEPHGLRVVWANGRTRLAAGAPGVGSELGGSDPLLGGTASEAIRRMLASDEETQALIEHTDWMNPAVTVRSVAWRLSSACSNEPVVVLMQMPEVGAPHAAARHTQFHDQATHWAHASAATRHLLQSESGLGSMQRALRTLVTSSGARDGLLALCRGTDLRTATSVGGSLAARALPLDRCADLVGTLRDGELDWLCDGTKAALGIPAYAGAVAIPMLVGGERLGAVVLVFEAEFAVGDGARELMAALGASFAATLLRENAHRRTAASATAAPARERIAA